MRRHLLVALLVVAAVGCAPIEGESPITGGSPSSTVQAAVHGTVKDAAGRPVPGVMVAAVSLDDPPQAIPELAVVSDEAGGFEWPLPPGRYQLAAGGPPVEVTVEGGHGPAVDLIVQ